MLSITIREKNTGKVVAHKSLPETLSEYEMVKQGNALFQTTTYAAEDVYCVYQICGEAIRKFELN